MQVPANLDPSMVHCKQLQNCRLIVLGFGSVLYLLHSALAPILLTEGASLFTLLLSLTVSQLTPNLQPSEKGQAFVLITQQKDLTVPACPGACEWGASTMGHQLNGASKAPLMI